MQQHLSEEHKKYHHSDYILSTGNIGNGKKIGYSSKNLLSSHAMHIGGGMNHHSSTSEILSMAMLENTNSKRRSVADD